MKPKNIAYYEINDPLKPKLWVGRRYDAFVPENFKLTKDKSWELCVICSKPVSDGHGHEL